MPKRPVSCYSVGLHKRGSLIFVVGPLPNSLLFGTDVFQHRYLVQFFFFFWLVFFFFFFFWGGGCLHGGVSLSIKLITYPKLF